MFLKTITKILAWRLRPIMGFLVHPCQCSFIPNHNNGDNIIIAQEVIHTMRSQRKGRGWLAVKFNLGKAYGASVYLFCSHEIPLNGEMLDSFTHSGVFDRDTTRKMHISDETFPR